MVSLMRRLARGFSVLRQDVLVGYGDLQPESKHHSSSFKMSSLGDRPRVGRFSASELAEAWGGALADLLARHGGAGHLLGTWSLCGDLKTFFEALLQWHLSCTAGTCW